MPPQRRNHRGCQPEKQNCNSQLLLSQQFHQLSHSGLAANKTPNILSPPRKIKPFEVVRFVDRSGCCTPQPLLAGSYMSFLQVAGPQQYVPDMPYVIFNSFTNTTSLNHSLFQNHLPFQPTTPQFLLSLLNAPLYSLQKAPQLSWLTCLPPLQEGLAKLSLKAMGKKLLKTKGRGGQRQMC